MACVYRTGRYDAAARSEQLWSHQGRGASSPSRSRREYQGYGEHQIILLLKYIYNAVLKLISDRRNHAPYEGAAQLAQ